jgi:formylglycine-generating enzyme required for sulfatase activity
MSLIKRRFFLKWLALTGISTVGVISCNFNEDDAGGIDIDKFRLQPYEFETVKVNGFGTIIQQKTINTNIFHESISNDLFLDMVLVPGGHFMMGSPESEIFHKSNESPLRSVKISKFLMGKHTINQQKWKIIANLPKIRLDLPSSPSKFRGSELPVENISWLEANEFCLRLSKYTRRVYRLPTEAEWEYACRAKTHTPFPYGPTITSELANFNGEQPYASQPKGIFLQRTVDVGEFTANAFGLYQMNGNIWEWCLDSWHNSYMDAPIDGRAWLTESNVPWAVLRGGSWGSSGERCRSAARFQAPHQYRGGDVGFRVVCTA